MQGETQTPVEELLSTHKDTQNIDREVELQEMLRQFFLDLKEEDRVLLLLRYYYNYSISEIANMLGKKQDTVRKKLYRLVNRLRKTHKVSQKD